MQVQSDGTSPEGPQSPIRRLPAADLVNGKRVEWPYALWRATFYVGLPVVFPLTSMIRGSHKLPAEPTTNPHYGRSALSQLPRSVPTSISIPLSLSPDLVA
jgi:hypothetical protein